MIRLGIGVTTFRRSKLLARTLDGIARHTLTPHTLIVADDGSPDDTLDMLSRRRVPHIAGPNRGIAWNKNRALFHLHEVARCDVILMVEDDVAPVNDGWELPWIEATKRWGHANLAGPWFSELFQSGSGTLEDPVISSALTGQCCGFSRAALLKVGYMDTRFGRYGFEHCEHSERIVRAGYGGIADPVRYYLLKSNLNISGIEEDYRSDLDNNSGVYAEVSKDPTMYRQAWRCPEEWRQIRADLSATVVYDARHRTQVLAARLRAALLGERGFKRPAVLLRG